MSMRLWDSKSDQRSSQKSSQSHTIHIMMTHPEPMDHANKIEASLDSAHPHMYIHQRCRLSSENEHIFLLELSILIIGGGKSSH